jgi:hypothetical protein
MPDAFFERVDPALPSINTVPIGAVLIPLIRNPILLLPDLPPQTFDRALKIRLGRHLTLRVLSLDEGHTSGVGMDLA